jgi:DNA-binding transcriptional regulator LsrR (DeoR family)
MKVIDDYIYLINEKNIYKVSISREKRHETLELSEYIDSTFSLLNVIIVNDKLMYLPLIKKVNEGVSTYYKYCLYKYEV